MVSRAELLQLAHFAQKHKLIVVADEVYEHMIYDNEQHVRFAALHVGLDDASGNGSTLTSTSTCALSASDREAMQYAAQHTYTIGSAGKVFITKCIETFIRFRDQSDGHADV